MASSDKGDSAQQPFRNFKLNKRFIKFNDNNNIHMTTTIVVPPLSNFVKREKEFTHLNESLPSIMS